APPSAERYGAATLRPHSSARLPLCPPPSPSLSPYTTLFRSTVVMSTSKKQAIKNQRLFTNQGTNPKNKYHTSRIRGSSLAITVRSEEHTSELQSRFDLVCRLLLEKKKTDMT